MEVERGNESRGDPRGEEGMVRVRGVQGMLAALAAVALIATACGTGEEAEQVPEEDADLRGGTLTVQMESFVHECNFDPTCEFVSYAIMIHTNLLQRPLMNYRHIADDPGLEILPDLAADMPEISEDGLTYTFTLKDGVMFAPPVNREVTSQDVAYAFQRMASQQQGNPYTYYFEGVIDGFELQKAPAEDIQISGIETPDDKTISITLAEPVPDILFRLAMPGTAPIPQEVASCFPQSGEYGRFVISSGPYMLEGSEALDISSCDTMEPIAGYEPDRTLNIVRNPNYDAATDDPEMRSNNPDRFEFSVNTNVDDIFNRIVAGETDVSPDDPPAQFLRQFAEDTERLPSNPVDVLWYIVMNLTQPPFDDINVRRAVNYAIDKDGLLRAAGGELVGEIATHILPPTMGGLPSEEYDPFATEGFAGDVDLAKEEMAQSAYDTDGDGVCDAPECTGILHISRNEAPWTEFNPIIEDNLAEIGIELETREIEGGVAYELVSTTSENVPIASHAGWGKDWPDASTFFEALFTSGAIQPGPGVNNNPSLVGITQEINEERELGIEGNLQGIPNIDAQFEECVAMELGQPRLDCFNEVDRTLMEEVVPYVPYRWDEETHLISENITKWEFDQNAGEMSLAHIAVAS
jgi:peptide/nickel transport system substrate-binding protein